MRGLRFLAVLVLFTGLACLYGQTTSGSAGSPIPVKLGNSAVDLYGPWRFHIGDDPAWAQPGFDDSSWEQVDLHSPDGADPDLGTSGFVPGWTSQGHPDYSGFAWYRLRVHVEGARTAISLKMPDGSDDAFQVFVNGQKIGEFGHFQGSRVTAYSALPQGFRFPSDLRSGDMLIAIRVWMDSATRFSAPDAGGLHGPPVLGLAPTVATQVRLDWDDAAHGVGSGFLEVLILLLALSVTLTHFWLDRNDETYLWLGLVCLATLLSNLIVLAANFTMLIPQTLGVWLKDVVLMPLRIGLWIMFWVTWFRLGPPRWFRVAVASLVLLLATCMATLRPPLHGPVIPLSTGAFFEPATVLLRLALAALLLWVLIRAVRRDRTEALLALPAVLLAIAANYQNELRLLHIPIHFSLFRFQVSLGEASTMLSLLLITAMLSRRFLWAQRRKVQMQLEIQQARDLQALIIPSHLPAVPGLRIESEYLPSREVGGDFFQIIPGADDGSVLIVVGDVTGKGLQAGMLVAMIVGVIDSTARQNPDPEYVLGMLNDRLCGRGYATATCLAMRITADGHAVIASAGHLPPYLNGREMDMEGALPLGMLSDVDYTAMCFQLEQGDTVVLLTDGVVEAQDSNGVLLGFDRVSAMIEQHATATEMANAALAHGQEDDILVLRVERTATSRVLAPAVA